jgi:UDP-N-acetylmuramoylalanine--D-glutamate ligase
MKQSIVLLNIEKVNSDERLIKSHNRAMNINRESFEGQKVVVFGLGTNGGGLGTVQFLLGTDAREITVTDQKSEAELERVIAALPDDPRLVWHLGGHTQEDFETGDIIIPNPSIRPDHPLLERAREHGGKVWMDSAIFLTLCSASVIGVTGSKGKTTTASLIAHILEESGREVVPVGISQTGVLSELQRVTPESTVVFELSSWRLAGLASVQKSPRIAVITNLYPDHLNYYHSMEEYARDKKYITEFQTEKDVLVVSGENEWSEFFIAGTKATIKTFGGNDTFCAWQDEGDLWYWQGEGDRGPVRILEKEKSLLQGKHLFDNMLAAMLACKNFGVSLEDITRGLETFPGVPHRFELVREVGGVRYINDTAATIPSAALASVQSLSGPVILLAGVSDKSLPQDDLIQAIHIAKRVILFAGSGTKKLLAELDEGVKEKCLVVENMKDAVIEAQKVAMSGDTILLAPGAASFGMFQNEFDRGEQFCRRVQELEM